MKDGHTWMVFYLIRYGIYIEDGYIRKLASGEDSIKKIIEEDDGVIKGKGIIDINVDFEKGEINYTYKNWYDETEEMTLYFDEVTVV